MKYFGTDGFRGRANEGLDVEHAFKIGRFVGWYYGARQGRKARVIIGKDTRRSSYMFESALVAGLVASGADAYMLHVIPTPGVCYEVVDGGFDCGVMITASHNPYSDNGIKLVNSEGYKMDEAVLQQVEDYIDGKSEVPLAHGDAIGCTVDYMQGRNRYISHLIASCGFSLQGLKIGLDCANGSASSVARPVFDALGAETHVINNAPNGFNINVDCGSTHLDQLQRFVVQNGLDVGFAYDGDADRCLAVDERGHVVDGDLLLYVCGTYLNKHGRLGGEQSGHIIFGDLEKTGDGIMTSLRVMEVLRSEREKLSELCRPVTLYPQQLVNVHVTDKDAAMASEAVTAAVEEAERFLEGNGRVLVRASGTEPLVRVLAEAPEESLCTQANQIVIDALEPYRA